jgi:hypothetical protein
VPHRGFLGVESVPKILDSRQDVRHIFADSGDLISAALSARLWAMLGWSETMTLEQFEQVNARLREYFDPVQLLEWWGSRQPLLL